jgi:hypothetical protein
MRLRSSLLFFIGKAVLFMIAIAIAWYFIYPAYNDLLASTANLFHPTHTKIVSYGKDTLRVYLSGSSRAYEIYGLDLQYGLLIVLALIAATPGLRLIKRLKFSLIALVIMFLIHVASVLVFAKVASSANTSTISSNPYVVFFCIIGPDLFPALVWMVLSFRQFFPKPETTDAKPKKRT